jgi:AraC-like DNA-binding protein
MEFGAVGATPIQVPSAIVTGAGTTSYVTRIDPGQTVMTVHFRPAGARAFFGMPLSELQDRCVGIDDIWGGQVRSLSAQLTETTSTAGRLAVLERFLLDRMEIHDGRIHELLARLDTDPSTTVAEVCALTGLAPKRLTALFGSQVGLTPKAYLRVRRLQSALLRLEAGTHSGADIAANLGYFDQAHFVRDFRSFTAITPSQTVRCRLPHLVWIPCPDRVSSPCRRTCTFRPSDGWADRIAAAGTWLFGTDDPAELVRDHGWSAEVTDIAEPGNRWNRWYAPVTPADVSDAPRGYFAIATKG